MKHNIITVDFDGVVIEKVFGLDWNVQGKSTKVKSGIWFEMYKMVDKKWTEINHKWRKPVKGSFEGIKRLKNEGNEIVLLTSRHGYQKEETIKWMKKWGYFELYDQFYFNDKEIGAVDSKIENIKKIGSDIHIDDNLLTVQELGKTYPQLKIFFLKNDMDDVDLKNVKCVQRWGEIVAD